MQSPQVGDRKLVNGKSSFLILGVHSNTVTVGGPNTSARPCLPVEALKLDGDLDGLGELGDSHSFGTQSIC